MSLNTAIVAALESVASLKRKVYPLEALKNAAAPFIIYRRISADEDQALDGGTGLQSARYEINAVAKTYAELEALSVAVWAALKTLQGPVSGDVLFERVVCAQASPDLYESEVHLYRRVYDLQINYQEVNQNG